MKNFPTAHKSHKSAKKSVHQEHADNLFKLAHPANAKRQKAFRRTLTHVVLPIALIVSTATFAIGAEVIQQKNSTKAAPAVPANSVCRVYDYDNGGLAAQDSRIAMSLSAPNGPTWIKFSGLKLTYLYAEDGYTVKYGLNNLSNNKLATTGASLIYVKACAVNPGPAMPPFTSRSALVDQQYRDFTGASATAAQQASWAERTKDMTASQGARYIVTAFVNGEAAQRGPLARLYKAYYKRWPDAGGYDYWVRKMKGGMSLTKVSDTFANANEFKTKYGSVSNREFVLLVYNNVLSRTPDQGGLDYWTKKLDDKKITRGGVMLQFSESSENKRKQGLNSELVGVSLRMYRRAATDAELAQWNPDEDAGTLAYPIIFQSTEYKNRVVK